MISNIETCIPLVKEARKILVLTGAGISTESGIPDFRSKEGIYSTAPEKILSRQFFFEKTEIFYEFFLEKLYHPEALPNDGHNILSKWEKENKIRAIVTQNIDGLHSDAGNEKVIEFHGSIKSATCYNPKCNREYTIEELVQRKEKSEKFFFCDCGKSGTRRIIKPDVVLFGDVGKNMNRGNIATIRKMAWEVDLILVLGTSLEVYPFSDIIRYRNKRIHTIIINKGTTPFDDSENVYVIKEAIGETLKKIDEKM